MLLNLTQFWYDRRHKLSPDRGSKNTFHAATDQVQKNGLVARFAQAAAGLWQALTVVDTEPRVQSHVDRAGRVVWTVYDPISNATSVFDSENQVRIWLEERYTHSSADGWQPIVER